MSALEIFNDSALYKCSLNNNNNNNDPSSYIKKLKHIKTQLKTLKNIFKL